MYEEIDENNQNKKSGVCAKVVTVLVVLAVIGGGAAAGVLFLLNNKDAPLTSKHDLHERCFYHLILQILTYIFNKYKFAYLHTWTLDKRIESIHPKLLKVERHITI